METIIKLPFLNDVAGLSKLALKEPAHLSAKLVIRLTSSIYNVGGASFH